MLKRSNHSEKLIDFPNSTVKYCGIFYIYLKNKNMKKIVYLIAFYFLTLSDTFACIGSNGEHKGIDSVQNTEGCGISATQNAIVNPQTLLYIIIALVLWEFILTKVLGYLNHKNKSPELPEELKEIYDEEKYAKSINYENTKYKFGLISSVFSIIITLAMLMFGGFGWLDSFVRDFTQNPVLLALAFFWIISFVQTIIGLPFSYYSTFVIEEKFGFNKMTKKLFFLDTIKGLILSSLLGGGILALVVWIYSIAGDNFWLYAWGLMTFISVFFMMFYSSLIVPIFNKQTPLEDGELRDAIQKFSNKVGFKLDNIFVIDGSKRSSKANAYFSGFGPKKRIVLYDTLIKDLETEELVAVLAHEIGHYKRKHTLQMLAFSTLQTWFMFYVFGLALSFPEVSLALWATEGSFHIGSIAFGILFAPISIIMGLFASILSRKNEYEADEFAALNYDAEKLISALKKLSRNNLSNLTPHPAFEFFYYSHPNPLKRFAALRNVKK